MTKINGLILTLVFSAGAVYSVTAQISGVYTNLTADNWRTTAETLETEASVRQCGGFGAWSLTILDDDDERA